MKFEGGAVEESNQQPMELLEEVKEEGEYKELTDDEAQTISCQEPNSNTEEKVLEEDGNENVINANVSLPTDDKQALTEHIVEDMNATGKNEEFGLFT